MCSLGVLKLRNCTARNSDQNHEMMIEKIVRIYREVYTKYVYPVKGDPLRDLIDEVIAELNDKHPSISISKVAKGILEIEEEHNFPLLPKRIYRVSIFNIIAAWCTPKLLITLLNHGADLFYNRKEDEGMNSLYKPPIVSLVCADNISALRALFASSHGTRVLRELPDLIYWENLLSYACTPEMIRFLVSIGLNVEGNMCTKRSYRSPLEYFLANSKYTLVETLVECGADLKKVGPSGRNLLSYVIRDLSSSDEQAASLISKMCEHGAFLNDCTVIDLLTERRRSHAFTLEVLHLFLFHFSYFPSLLCLKRALLFATDEEFFSIYAKITLGGTKSVRHRSPSRIGTFTHEAAQRATGRHGDGVLHLLACDVGGYDMIVQDAKNYNGEDPFNTPNTRLIVAPRLQINITLFDILYTKMILSERYDLIKRKTK